MSSAVSLKTTPTDLGASSARVRVNGPLDRIRQIRDAIAHRAYELFQKRGKASGSDQEDWYCAETELIHQVHTTVLETDVLLLVFAELPGFHSDNLVLKVEPRSITIAGQREPLSHAAGKKVSRSEEHTSELQSPDHLVCRLLLEKKKSLTRSINLCHNLPSIDPT